MSDPNFFGSDKMPKWSEMSECQPLFLTLCTLHVQFINDLYKCTYIIYIRYMDVYVYYMQYLYYMQIPTALKCLEICGTVVHSTLEVVLKASASILSEITGSSEGREKLLGIYIYVRTCTFWASTVHGNDLNV